MEAKDLMIGDWVLDGNHIAQVVLVTCDGIIGTTFNKGSNIEVVEPIPLTPEILEKNGFVRNETWAEWVHYCDNIFIDFTILENGTSFHLDLPNAMIDYVHELQHALRLCGINKEIEL